MLHVIPWRRVPFDPLNYIKRTITYSILSKHGQHVEAPKTSADSSWFSKMFPNDAHKPAAAAQPNLTTSTSTNVVKATNDEAATSASKSSTRSASTSTTTTSQTSFSGFNQHKLFDTITNILDSRTLSANDGLLPEMRTHARNGDLEALETRFKALKSAGSRIPQEAYHLMTMAFSKAGDERVEYYMKQTSEAGFVVPEATKRALARMYSDLDLLDKALPIWKALKEPSWPQVVHHILSSCARSGRMEIAETVAAELKQGGHMLSGNAHKTMISGYSKLGNMTKAEQWLNSMNSLGWLPDAATFNVLIAGCIQTRLLVKANEYLKRMIDEGVKPSCGVVNVLMDVCAKSIDVERMETIWRDSLGCGFSPNWKSFDIRVRGFASARQLEKAREVMDEMSAVDFGPNAVTYYVMLKAYARENQLDEAEKLFVRMKELGVVSRTTKMEHFLTAPP